MGGKSLRRAWSADEIMGRLEDEYEEEEDEAQPKKNKSIL